MILINLLILGSLTYSGVRALKRNRPKLIASLHATDSTFPPSHTSLDPISTSLTLQQADKQTHSELLASSLGLGLSISGIFNPLLGLASVPLTLYSNLPMIEQAIDTSLNKDRSYSSIVGSFVVISGLAFRRFPLAASVQWLYSLNRKLRFEQERATLNGDYFGDNVPITTFVDFNNRQKTNNNSIILDASKITDLE